MSSPGFDPEDPAVKELEEWELRSQADKSINLEVYTLHSLTNKYT